MKRTMLPIMYVVAASALLSVSCGDENKNQQNPGIQGNNLSGTKGANSGMTKLTQPGLKPTAPIVTPVTPQMLFGQWQDGICRSQSYDSKSIYYKLLYEFNQTNYRIRRVYFFNSSCASSQHVEPQKIKDAELSRLGTEGFSGEYKILQQIPGKSNFAMNYSYNGSIRYGAITMQQGRIYLGWGCTLQQKSSGMCSQDLGQSSQTRQTEVDMAVPLNRL